MDVIDIWTGIGSGSNIGAQTLNALLSVAVVE